MIFQAKSYTLASTREQRKIYQILNVFLKGYRNSDKRKTFKNLDNQNTPCKNWSMEGSG